MHTKLFTMNNRPPLSISHNIKFWLFAGFIVCFCAFVILANTTFGRTARAFNPFYVTDDNAYLLQYTLDRTAVPDLTFNDLTVIVDIGTTSDYSVYVDGSEIATYNYDGATGELMITTSGEALNVWVNHDGPPAAGFGDIHASLLKDGKKWAWSHGFDDNTFLEGGADLFEAYGWQSSFFIIGSLVQETRDEYWIFDKPALTRYLEAGWSLGGHGWGTSCTDTNQTAVEQSLDLLEGIIAESTRPDYKLISFASPCFVAEYHPIVITIRDEGNYDLQMNESGGRYLMNLDTNVTADYTQDGQQVSHFDFDTEIGRDPQISYANASTSTIEIFDWLATHASADEPFWYNTLAHGNNEDNIEPVIDYVYDNYGPAGTDEAWVVPSDHIYSYMLVRENTIITQIGETELTAGVTPHPNPTVAPSATPTITPTPIDTAIPVPPTSTPTPTVTDLAAVSIVDAATDSVIHTVRYNETVVINLAHFGEGLNLSAVPNDGFVSVVYDITVDNSWRYDRVRNSFPFPFCGFTNGDYEGCASNLFSEGHSYDFIVTPYSNQWGQGTAGIPFVFRIEVIDDDTIVATATPDVTATPMPTATPISDGGGAATMTPTGAATSIYTATPSPTMTPTPYGTATETATVTMTPTPDGTPTLTPTPGDPALDITSLNLIDAGTDTAVRSVMPNEHLVLNVREYTNGVSFSIETAVNVSSVRYLMTVDQSWSVSSVRNGTPYAFCSFTDLDYHSCFDSMLNVGHSYDFVVTPYERQWATGTPGSVFMFSLEVVDQAIVAPAPTPTPTTVPDDTVTEIVPTNAITPSDDLEWTWDDSADSCTYHLYEENLPYADLGTAAYLDISSGFGVTGVIDSDQNHFYILQADCGDYTVESNEIGVVNFELTAD